MFLQHINAEQQIDVDVVQYLQRAFNRVAFIKLESAGVDPTQDHAGADTDCHPFESGVNLLNQACSFCETAADNGALGTCVYKGLELDTVDLHIDVQHSGLNEALGQMFLCVFSIGNNHCTAYY